MPEPMGVARAASAIWAKRRWLYWLVAFTSVVPLLGFGVIFAAAGGSLSSSESGSLPSQLAMDTIPPEMLRLYQAAAGKHGLGWEYLAAIGQVESHHGKLDTGCETSSAGARGPMQFMPATWASYGAGGDICDPADSVDAAARYLKASGAPKDWDRALFAYNHAGWYVSLVQDWAAKYRGPLGTMPGLPTDSGHSQALNGRRWLAKVPGTNAVCDRRIVPDVVAIIEKYKMTVGDCFAMTGHAINGEHPLGLGIDLYAGSGGWKMVDRAARDFGWRMSCASSGCRGQLPSPMDFIGWNGFAGHGDPAHAGENAHLHFSWWRTDAKPGSPAGRVKTLLPAEDKP